MLYVRDNIAIIPALRDGAPTTGPINNLQISNAAGYFTEPIDVGTFIEGIIFVYTTAHGGTNPTLDINMQYGYLGTDNQYHWLDSGDAVAQITTTDGVFIKKMTANFGKFIRFKLLVAGTATPTYTLSMRVVMKG